jgi:hypothetical protein
MLRWLTWDRMWPLRESGGPLIEKGGECDMESQHLQNYSPRLCWLRIDGLALVSKYWRYWSHAGDMGPVNLCSMFVNKYLAFITASMIVKGEKLGGGPADRSTNVLGIVSGALFLWAVGSIQLCWVSVKGCHVRRLPVGSVRVAYVDWHG